MNLAEFRHTQRREFFRNVTSLGELLKAPTQVFEGK